MSDDTSPTPKSQEAAQPVDASGPPSWQIPMKTLDTRVTKLEAAAVVTNAKLESIEQKTDQQTFILARLDKVATDPKVRLLFALIVAALAAWLAQHGIKVEIPQ